MSKARAFASPRPATGGAAVQAMPGDADRQGETRLGRMIDQGGLAPAPAETAIRLRIAGDFKRFFARHCHWFEFQRSYRAPIRPSSLIGLEMSQPTAPPPGEDDQRASARSERPVGGRRRGRPGGGAGRVRRAGRRGAARRGSLAAILSRTRARASPLRAGRSAGAGDPGGGRARGIGRRAVRLGGRRRGRRMRRSRSLPRATSARSRTGCRR